MHVIRLNVEQLSFSAKVVAMAHPMPPKLPLPRPYAIVFSARGLVLVDANVELCTCLKFVAYNDESGE